MPIVTSVSYLTTSGAAAAVGAPSAITPAAATPMAIANRKALARTGSLNEAERLAREAVAISSGTADILDLRAEALADLGEVLRLTGRLEESQTAIEEAIGLYDEKGNVIAAGRLRVLLAEPPVEV